MKRYDKYKETKYSWLGCVPSHWDELFLSQCATEQSLSNKTVHNQNLLSLSYGTIIRKNINTTDGLLPASFDTYQIVHNGNIILRLTDLQNDKHSLRTGLATETGIITSAYVALKCYKHIKPSFLHKLLHTYDIRKLFYGLGGGLRQGCSYKDLRKLLVYIPTTGEQEQIVRYLDWKVSLINKFVKEKKREVALLKELKNAEINHAVTRGLNPDAPLKDSGIKWIGSVPERWEIKNFCQYFTFGKGLPITKEDLRENGVEVISYGQIHSKLNNSIGLNKSLIKYVSTSYLDTHAQSLLNRGDFVFADTSEDVDGSGNNIFINTTHSVFAGYHTLIIRAQNLGCPEYYAYLFLSMRWKRQVQGLVNGVKVFSINKSILKKTKLLIPPLFEQGKIVNYIADKEGKINKAISDIEREIDLVKEYRARLISDVVTGKVDVRGIVVPDFQSELEIVEATEEEADEQIEIN